MTHVKNVDGFAEVVKCCISFGERYQPWVEGLGVDELSARLSEAHRAMTLLIEAEAHFYDMAGERKQKFAALARLAGQAVFGLVSSGAPAAKLKKARRLARQVAGKTPARMAAGEEPSGGPLSQLAYVHRADALAQLVELVSSEPGYPDEPACAGRPACAGGPACSREVLEMRAAEAEGMNVAVMQARIALNHARMGRDKVMYTDPDAVMVLARKVKKYVAAVFGPRSAEWRYVSRRLIRRPNA